MGQELCDTKLGLAMGGGDNSASTIIRDGEMKPQVRLHLWFPFDGNEEEEEEAKTEITESMKMDTHKTKEDNCSVRKKLRLTKEQYTLLEDSFRCNQTLTPVHKEELAQRLALRPRQIEVWFQNRRARTKLKQTETDCEELRRWCDNLRDENNRLKRVLDELKFYGSEVKAMEDCPSCEKKARVLQFCN
ncbi:Homeobox-leucine zipper protein HAT9 [Platanthera zijinensis]|uniref:Homeobox-leucine zipper protein HAT9 n=1 Tax=Platanthera zijinensis TaxID=2320716 RepID=A0AAP0BXY9_9ASPA